MDYVNQTAPVPPVARQVRIRPSGREVWPPLYEFFTAQIDAKE